MNGSVNNHRKVGGFRFSELFAGVGGFGLGLTPLGGECAFSCDINPHSRMTYFANYRQVPSGNIRLVDPKAVPKHDILTAGFPCQPFSWAGKRQGREDSKGRGLLFGEIVRIAAALRPPVLFLENVAHILDIEDGEVVRDIRKRLRSVGYGMLVEPLDSSDYGVPQSRNRAYFVCFRRDLGIREFEFPAPTNKPVKVADILEPESSETRKLEVMENFRWVKNPKAEDPNRPIRLAVWNNGGQGRRVHSIEGVSPTLCAFGGRGVPSFLIGKTVRRPTVLECKRLMGFSDSFDLFGSTRIQALQLLGNAVIPSMVTLVGERILATPRKAGWKPGEEP